MRKFIAGTILVIFFIFINAEFIYSQTTIKRVAVLNFMDYSTSGKYNRLIQGLPELLSQELGSFPEITIVERMRIDDLLREMDLTRNIEFDPATVSRIGKLLGVQTVILGGLYEVAGQIKLSARLVWVETGEIERGFEFEGVEKNLFEIIKNLAHDIRYAWSGSLRVSSSPRGSVRINGKSYGYTPVFSEGLKGEYSVTIEKSGYSPKKFNVDIAVGEREKIDVSLHKTDSTLQKEWEERVRERDESMEKRQREREMRRRAEEYKRNKEIEAYNKRMRKWRGKLGIVTATAIAGGIILGIQSLSKEEKETEEEEENSFGRNLLQTIGWSCLIAGSLAILGTFDEKPKKPGYYVGFNFNPIKKGFSIKIIYRF